jgi:hypothetical protein
VQCYPEELSISNKIFAAKERKEHMDKNLCCLFFVLGFLEQERTEKTEMIRKTAPQLPLFSLVEVLRLVAAGRAVTLTQKSGQDSPHFHSTGNVEEPHKNPVRPPESQPGLCGRRQRIGFESRWIQK